MQEKTRAGLIFEHMEGYGNEPALEIPEVANCDQPAKLLVHTKGR